MSPRQHTIISMPLLDTPRLTRGEPLEYTTTEHNLREPHNPRPDDARYPPPKEV